MYVEYIFFIKCIKYVIYYIYTRTLLGQDHSLRNLLLGIYNYKINLLYLDRSKTNGAAHIGNLAHYPRWSIPSN